MVAITKTYNLEIKGTLFSFTEQEIKELFNALDCVLNNKTYSTKLGGTLSPSEFRGPFIAESTSPDPWARDENYIERQNRNKFHL